MKKTGLFGGTFDPIHYGHLRSAWEVRERFEFNRIFIIPAAIPPHKRTKTIENAEDRLEMIRLATAGYPEFKVSDIELTRTGPSYTIDTVEYFKSQCEVESLFFFIIGSDAFLELDTWKAYLDLLKLVPFVVMIRPDASCPDISVKEHHIYDFLSSRVSEQYSYHSGDHSFVHPERPPVFIQKVTSLDISSTHIRRLIKQNRSIRFLVPEAVEQYIKAKGLYQ